MNMPRTAILGFQGGNNMFELGRQQDMVVFFRYLDCLTLTTLNETGRFVLLDRLFKRYLREEDLDEAIAAMNVVKQQFGFVTVNSAKLIEFGLDESHTLLPFLDGTLLDIFDKYFYAFFYCVDSYRRGKKMFGYYYNPVKVSRIDTPGFTEDDARPEKAYDDLVGPPFWFPETTRNDPTGEPQLPAC